MKTIGEHTNDGLEALQAAMEGNQAALRTAMPGIVVSFNAAAGTVVVQPALMASIRAQDGSASFKPLPLLMDVPVVFPGGGGFSLTFPVTAGDECLVVFGDRCIDAWWQHGGTQAPMEPRMHSLSDAFALVGIRNQTRALGAYSTTHAQLRSDDGTLYLEMQPGGVLKVVAPSGMQLIGNLDVTGNITATGTAHMTGSITAHGDILALDTISLGHHTHSDPQGGSVGPPI